MEVKYCSMFQKVDLIYVGKGELKVLNISTLSSSVGLAVPCGIGGPRRRRRCRC